MMRAHAGSRRYGQRGRREGPRVEAQHHRRDVRRGHRDVHGALQRQGRQHRPADVARAGERGRPVVVLPIEEHEEHVAEAASEQSELIATPRRTSRRAAPKVRRGGQKQHDAVTRYGKEKERSRRRRRLRAARRVARLAHNDQFDMARRCSASPSRSSASPRSRTSDSCSSSPSRSASSGSCLGVAGFAKLAFHPDCSRAPDLGETLFQTPLGRRPAELSASSEHAMKRAFCILFLATVARAATGTSGGRTRAPVLDSGGSTTSACAANTPQVRTGPASARS